MQRRISGAVEARDANGAAKPAGLPDQGARHLRRADALDAETGARLDDVLMFRVADLGVKELMLADNRGVFFTTPHFDGYAAVLLRIRDLGRLDRDELKDLVAEAWLTKAPRRIAKAWLEEHGFAEAADDRRRQRFSSPPR
jgi:hypothetical protein